MTPEPLRRPARIGQRWTEDERAQLRAEILEGIGWDRLASLHGRTIAGVRAEAEKQGFVEQDLCETCFEYIGAGKPHLACIEYERNKLRINSGETYRGHQKSDGRRHRKK